MAGTVSLRMILRNESVENFKVTYWKDVPSSWVKKLTSRSERLDEGDEGFGPIFERAWSFCRLQATNRRVSDLRKVSRYEE